MSTLCCSAEMIDKFVTLKYFGQFAFIYSMVWADHVADGWFFNFSPSIAKGCHWLKSEHSSRSTSLFLWHTYTRTTIDESITAYALQAGAYNNGCTTTCVCDEATSPQSTVEGRAFSTNKERDACASSTEWRFQTGDRWDWIQKKGVTIEELCVLCRGWLHGDGSIVLRNKSDAPKRRPLESVRRQSGCAICVWWHVDLSSDILYVDTSHCARPEFCYEGCHLAWLVVSLDLLLRSLWRRIPAGRQRITFETPSCSPSCFKRDALTAVAVNGVRLLAQNLNVIMNQFLWCRCNHPRP